MEGVGFEPTTRQSIGLAPLVPAALPTELPDQTTKWDWMDLNHRQLLSES